jgi:ubiquinone biosynthesis monooxygenase Coq7
MHQQAQLSARDRETIARILKVNHAGEHGAIQIYAAQVAIARRRYPDIAPLLETMRGHEIEHHRLFANAMPSRHARPCRLLFLWSWGGYLLGLTTALCGRRMIWICTEAVEEAVHHHLNDQLRFLATRDSALHHTIATIQTEEQAHLDHARQSRGKPGTLSRTVLTAISVITDLLILASTSGDSSRLKAELKAPD